MSQKQTSKINRSATPPQPSRADQTTAEIVRKGITLQQIHGTDYAAQFLKEKNVEIDVIMRVLMDSSSKRRYSDSPDVPPHRLMD